MSKKAKAVEIDLSDVLQGYLDAVEFTERSFWDDGEWGVEWSGDFSPGARKEALRDVRLFVNDNKPDLYEYAQETRTSGRDLADRIGTDFWFSRNGHGAGFFDRGSCGAFSRLQEAARSYGAVDTFLNRRGNAGFQ